MDFTNIMVALISGGVISSLIAWWANRESVKAGTYQSLVGTVDALNTTLNEERNKRVAEAAEFDQKVAALALDYDKKLASARASYEEKLALMKTSHDAQIAKLSRRIDELERERNELLIENNELRKQLQG